ncbi:MAG TPA: ABC transporter substrate-binding protein [Candidatus Binataceae bacterium]|nr:ABC transporter substrate-binding protein [Candidatus Binataceae bacterium]
MIASRAKLNRSIGRSIPAGRLAAVFALGALAIAMVAGCRPRRQGADHAREQVLYHATASDPRTFNPILVTDSASGQIIGDLFDSLIQTNPMTTLPEPRIAQSWEISPDQKTITFHLRHDVKWFDGQPLTSRDVLFTMKVIYDPKVPNSIRPGLTIDRKQIESEAPDDYTVVMHLPKPFAPLLYAIQIPIIPAHVLEPIYAAGKFNQSWGINTPVDQLIGDGAYKMTRYVQSQVVQYARNSDFWMKDEHGGALPRLRGQTEIIVQDMNAAYLRFLSGQIDIYGPRPEEVVDLGEKKKQLDITLYESGIDTGTLFFSFNRNPKHFVRGGVADPKLSWFTDINFLRAMAHAVDKKAMINLCFHGLAEPAVGDISPANKIFYDPNIRDYDYDPKLSAQLLESAGYHLAKPGVRVDPHGRRLEFNLMTNTGTPERDQICVIFKQDLENLGIKVNYRPVEFTTLVERIDSTFDWDCILIGFTGGLEPNDGADFLRSSGNLHMWNPDQATPATPWEAEIDRLLDEGASEMDETKRAPYYWKIQEILHDQLAVIETVRQQRYAAWKNSLENYQPTVWGLYRPEWIQFRAE